MSRFAERYPRELSGGQQQRVALARGLVFNPDVLLLDEPLGALDKNLREQMQVEIKRIHREVGITMIYVTHDQTEAMTMSDRVAVFSNGQSSRSARRSRSTTGRSTASSASSSATATSSPAASILRAPDGSSCRGSARCGSQRRRSLPAGEVELMIRPERLRLAPAATLTARTTPST